MSRSKARFQLAVLIFILLPATAGVLAVHASATCERFVRTYITKPVRNTVSKQTAAAWAAWRGAHPNWKPNPNSHRPKYVMTREEAVQKVNFACTVPTDSTNLDMLFTPADMLAPPPLIPVPPAPMQITEVDLPPDQTPASPSYETPVWTPLFPVYPPNFPLQSGIGGGLVPEPDNWLLTATGLGFVSLLLGIKASRIAA